MTTDRTGRVGLNTLSVYIGRSISLLLYLAVSIALANYLGDAKFGQFNLALTFIGMFDILVNFGTTQITVREIVFHPEDTDEIIGSVIALRMFMLGLSIGLGYLLSQILGYSSIEILLIIIFFGNFFVSTRLASIRKTIESPFEAALRMPVVIALQVLDSLILVTATFIAIHANADLLTLGVIYTVSNVPGTLAIGLWGLHTKRLRFRLSLERVKYMAHLGLPLMFFRLFSNINTRIDVLILDYYRGSSEVGLYTAATRLIYPLFFIVSSLSISFLPLLAGYYREKHEAFKPTFMFGIKLLFLIGIWIASVIVFQSSQIITLLFTNDYLPSVAALSILGISIFFVFMNFYFTDFLIIINKQKIATLVMGIVAGLNVLANFIFIPKYGFLAAAFTTLFSNACGFLMLMATSYAQAQIGFSLRFARYLLSAGAIFFLGAQLKDLQIFLYLPAQLIVVYASASIFGLIGAREREQAISFFRRV